MPFDYNSKFKYYYELVNSYLETTFSSLEKTAPKTIVDSMIYSVMNGGKRVRAIMCLAAAEMLGQNAADLKEFAVALECIHAYSLVHDDLPAMDNDDYRRGKLSTHKKFGEANGILAGDALLNFAFENCLTKKDFSSLDVKALHSLAQLAGYSGMIAGQVLDLEYSLTDCIDEEKLYEIYKNKTSKLIIAPLMIACEKSGGKFKNELYDYGYNLGIMFQIVDDIMDIEGTLEEIGKTPNKDEKENKLTSIKVFGLKGARERADRHYELALKAIKLIPNNEFFISLANQMKNRRK